MRIAKINCTGPNCDVSTSVSTKAKPYNSKRLLQTVNSRLKNQQNDSFTKMDDVAEKILSHKPIEQAALDEFNSLPKQKQDEHLLFIKFRKN